MISGDTILVKTISPRDPVTYRLRLCDVHEPFSGDGVRPSQYADNAKSFLEEKLAGKRVRILTGKGLQFDSLLGVVYVDQNCIKEDISREGLVLYRVRTQGIGMPGSMTMSMRDCAGPMKRHYRTGHILYNTKSRY